MDEFKASMGKHLGVGGVKCRCCNSYFRKSKKKLNRMARSGLRQRDIKQQSQLLAEDLLDNQDNQPKE